MSNVPSLEAESDTGGTSATLRQRNSRTVLDAVRRSPSPIRVAEIAKATRLSRPTVETVAEGLLSQGWLRLAEPDAAAIAPTVGRPARLYAFNERAGHVVGVDIGAHSVTVAIGDLRGGLVEVRRERVTPELSAAERLRVSVEAIRSTIADAEVSADSVLAMTVGTPGTVSPADERVWLSPGMPGWPDVDVRAALQDVVPCDVVLENDANLAAVGERERGVAAGCADMVFLLLGERLGAGIIANDSLIRGRGGAAGELGYIAVSGSKDRDPRFGPLESRVNASALVRLGEEEALRHPGGPLSDPALTAQGITVAATAGDRAAISVVRRLARTLADGIAPTLLTLNPEVLVIGGGVSLAGEVLRAALSDAIQRTVLHPPDVRLSALGDEAVVVGAVAQALSRVEVEVLARVSA